MNNVKLVFKSSLFALILVLLGCSTEPKIILSKVVDPSATGKVSRIAFVFQETTLKEEITYQRGLLPSSPATGAMGVYTFGKILTEQAKPQLAQHDIEVIFSGIAPPGGWREMAARELPALMDNVKYGTYVLTVFPVGGNAQRSGGTSTAKMIYEVRLIDMRGGKLRWSGGIEANARYGDTALSRQMNSVTLDAEYAKLFFDALTLQFKKEGLL